MALGMVQASASARSANKSARKPARRGRWRRILLWISGIGVALVALTYWLVHRYEWAGPLVANSLRAVIGVDAVAKIEDLVYAVEDRINRLTRKNEQPQAHWQVPAAPPVVSAAPAVAAASGSGAVPQPLPFTLRDPGPALKAWSAPGDGKWVPMLDPRRPGEPPYMLRSEE